MKKQFLLSFLTLFTIVFLLTGCKKSQSAPENKIQLGKSASKKITPSSEARTEVNEVEKAKDEEKSAPLEEPLKTDNQKFEGSQTLKRYLDDSPE